MKEKTDFDVVIIGGSFAGLSAAMALGRSLRHVLIIDSGKPCNRQTPHSHNFLTHDGEAPGVILEKARAEVLQYSTVKFFHGLAVKGARTDSGFLVTVESGEEFFSKKLIFSTGIRDTMPDIRGFKESWGVSVIHCPYCHGYEFRGKKTGIMATGEKGFHLAALVTNLTDHVTVFTSGKEDFSEEQISKLRKRGIEIEETAISEVEHKEGYISQVVLNDGRRIDLDALYAALPFTQHSDIPASLGCELTEQGYIKADSFQRTSIPGVYACGDNTNMMRSVANAVYSGNLTGAVVNRELTEEEF